MAYFKKLYKWFDKGGRPPCHGICARAQCLRIGPAGAAAAQPRRSGYRSPEDASFADVLDNPAIVTLGMIRTGDLDLWLNDSDTAAASHIANEILRLYHLSQARLRKALDN